jgi:hypothetical protein
MTETFAVLLGLGPLLLPAVLGSQEAKAGEPKLDLTQRYLLLATMSTSTLQKELRKVAAAGVLF